MDNFQIIQYGVISFIFLVFIMVLIVNVFKISKDMRKLDDQMETSRKILKRKDSNVYDLKTTRRDK